MRFLMEEKEKGYQFSFILEEQFLIINICEKRTVYSIVIR